MKKIATKTVKKPETFSSRSKWWLDGLEGKLDTSSNKNTFPATQIAKLLLLSKRHVIRLANEGVLPRNDEGRYHLAPTVQAYIKYLRETSKTGNLPESLAKERHRLTKAQADKAELENEKLKGELVPTDIISQYWLQIVVEFRSRMLGIPNKLSHQLSVENDIAVINDIIKQAVNEALTTLSEMDIGQITDNVLANQDIEDDNNWDKEDIEASAESSTASA